MGDLILSMKGITKSFSGVAALKNAALDLKAGEVVALMGENGAGKSTLMKILTGIYSKYSIWDRRSVLRDLLNLKKQESPSFIRSLT